MRLLEDRPAIFFEKQKAICVADLHLGLEYALKNRGINVRITPKVIADLMLLLENYRAKKLYILGDVRDSFVPWYKISFFFDELSKRLQKIYIIPGNHDGSIRAFIRSYSNITVKSARGITISEHGITYGLVHGHAHPSVSLLRKSSTLFIGHVHPAIFQRGRKIPAWHIGLIEANSIILLKKQRLKQSDINVRKVIILPAFNLYLPGSVINEFPRIPFLNVNKVQWITKPITYLKSNL